MSYLSAATQTITSGNIAFEVPPGAFSEDTIIMSDDPASSLVAGANSAAYSNLKFPSYLGGFTKEMSVLRNLSIVTGKKVRLKVNYSSLGINDTFLEQNLKLLLLSNNRWQIVEDATVNTITKQVIADLSHFSVYRLGRYVATSADLLDVVVFPNPADPANTASPTVKFANLTSGINVKIFSLTGELIKSVSDVSGLLEWDMKNQEGTAVARGLYIYIITNTAGEKVTGKLAIK